MELLGTGTWGVQGVGCISISEAHKVGTSLCLVSFPPAL